MLKYQIVGKSTQVGDQVYCKFYVKQRVFLVFWETWRSFLTECVIYYDTPEEANAAIVAYEHNKHSKDRVVKWL